MARKKADKPSGTVQFVVADWVGVCLEDLGKEGEYLTEEGHLMNANLVARRIVMDYLKKHGLLNHPKGKIQR